MQKFFVEYVAKDGNKYTLLVLAKDETDAKRKVHAPVEILSVKSLYD